MVELREAEVLAHHLESCLRVIRQGDVALNAEILDTLLMGASALEAVIVARRTGGPLPSGEHAIGSLRAMAASRSEPPSSDSNAAEPAQVPGWTVRFAPSPELVERGVKVDTIRARLPADRKDRLSRTSRASGGRHRVRLRGPDRRRGQSRVVERRWCLVPSRRACLPAVATELPPTAGEMLSSPRAWEVAAGAPGQLRPRRSGPPGRPDAARRRSGRLARRASRTRCAASSVSCRRSECRSLQEHDSLIERQLRDLRDGDHARTAGPGRRDLPPDAVRRPRPRARRRQARAARARRPEHGDRQVPHRTDDGSDSPSRSQRGQPRHRDAGGARRGRKASGWHHPSQCIDGR